MGDVRIPGVYPEPVEGAYVVLCVRFASLVRICSSRNRPQRSAGHATLDTGGWLVLARQGLSPCKMRQASLAAPTL
jgi:hypothetical protein